ncbi:MAG: dephospho-CoA kinase [Magnetococcales bacterium]|nr:dephospho-CoA kinase [Magnetococcales bacterium]
MSAPLFLVAVTGSLGCGKSRVSHWLAAQGAHLLDADQDARAALLPGSPAWQAVVAHFGPEILLGEESLSQRPIDRRRLGEIVFRDRAARQTLEALLHPRIYQRQALALARWQQEAPPGRTVLVVAEIPLLFETASADRFDSSVAVLCGAAQADRLQERTGMSAAIRQAVIAQQLPEPEKERLAQHRIDNSGPWEATEAQLRPVWQSVQRQASDPARLARLAWPHRWPESQAGAAGPAAG